jgi:hypothetical protein
MDKVNKPITTQYYTPWSKPFRIYDEGCQQLYFFLPEYKAWTFQMRCHKRCHLNQLVPTGSLLVFSYCDRLYDMVDAARLLTVQVSTVFVYGLRVGKDDFLQQWSLSFRPPRQDHLWRSPTLLSSMHRGYEQPIQITCLRRSSDFT